MVAQKTVRSLFHSCKTWCVSYISEAKDALASFW